MIAQKQSGTRATFLKEERKKKAGNVRALQSSPTNKHLHWFPKKGIDLSTSIIMKALTHEELNADKIKHYKKKENNCNIECMEWICKCNNYYGMAIVYKCRCACSMTVSVAKSGMSAEFKIRLFVAFTFTQILLRNVRINLF